MPERGSRAAVRCATTASVLAWRPALAAARWVAMAIVPSVLAALAAARWVAMAIVPSVLVALAGCGSNHRVSPYPDVDPAVLFRPRGDLDAQLARIGEEAAREGYREALRVTGVLPGGAPLVALGEEGVDRAGRPFSLVRVATPYGLVLGLGPPAFPTRDPSEPVELLASLVPGGAFPSGVDLTGDGTPDLAVRAPDGTLAVYQVHALGGTRYPVSLTFPPTGADDVNGDGRVDLLGRAAPLADDPLAPELVDVAIGTGSSFDNDHPDARAFHARLRDRPLTLTAPLEARARRAIEAAFHAIRAGEPGETAVGRWRDVALEIDQAPRLRPAFVRWTGLVAERTRP